jgi:hypothetical protein
MVTEIRIYFEGDEALRPGFRAFLGQIADAARFRRCRFSLIAANGTPVPDFHTAIKTHPNAMNVLLLDSEDAITQPLPELCTRKGLSGHSERVFWMAQAMESWLLADPDSLKKYYGNGFGENALRSNPHVEEIPKSDVLSRLKAATKTTKKREYHKTGHAPDLLAKVKPELVKAAAPNCKRLFEELLAKLAEDEQGN